MNMRARASGSPAATQRSQNSDTMSVSDVPSRPAWASHADNSAKKASFTPRLYSHNVRLAVRGNHDLRGQPISPATAGEAVCSDPVSALGRADLVGILEVILHDARDPRCNHLERRSENPRPEFPTRRQFQPAAEVRQVGHAQAR